uniref:Ubiquitin-like protease family profile domain-containing protein n=1 Tax=Ditylenchus dipsaci TaxID=166011 RepID=A0A915E6Y7_9BILA
MNFELLTSKKNKPMLKDPTASCTGILVFREENGPIGDAFTTELAGMPPSRLDIKEPPSKETKEARVSNKGEKDLLRDFLKEFAVERGYDEVNPSVWISHSPKDIPTQSNSFDCGAFGASLRTACLVKNQMKFSQNDMPLVRREIEEMIRAEKL